MKTLKEFQYIDEFGKDQGANGQSWPRVPISRSVLADELMLPTVRQKAKDITNLLLDDKRMSSQRAGRKAMRDRMAGERPKSGEGSRRQERPGAGADSDLEAALRASREMADEEARKNRGNGDAEFEEALRLSREEDERRRRELEASNGGSLFDDQQQQQQ